MNIREKEKLHIYKILYIKREIQTSAQYSYHLSSDFSITQSCSHIQQDTAFPKLALKMKWDKCL